MNPNDNTQKPGMQPTGVSQMPDDTLDDTNPTASSMGSSNFNTSSSAAVSEPEPASASGTVMQTPEPQVQSGMGDSTIGGQPQSVSDVPGVPVVGPEEPMNPAPDTTTTTPSAGAAQMPVKDDTDDTSGGLPQAS